MYDNLIRPFLKTTVTYSEVAGLKRRFLADKDDSYIQWLRWDVSNSARETRIEEIEPPDGYDSEDWVFFEITRELVGDELYIFDGDIYVLIDNFCFSAADMFANAVKRIGYATLVGTNTAGGGAAYIAPLTIRLPNSDMKFRVEAEMVINPDGSINELVGTPPDIELSPVAIPSDLTREVLIEDEWIKNIMAR